MHHQRNLKMTWLFCKQLLKPEFSLNVILQHCDLHSTGLKAEAGRVTKSGGSIENVCTKAVLSTLRIPAFRSRHLEYI
ncbi:hypothetical protein L596_016179 [Steinernema carpocapsae]|uniref:Uncharacterized protein n=1 Tax=Steinernema carpocapsae TaxID=34508 RepID=A0A4U5NI06_STECR|nr:hypothetical protein L596_016179 [Steinernema carpocapsae]